MIGAQVRVINGARLVYFGKTGVVLKTDRRDDRPYFGVKFEGVEHVAWFYDSELETVAIA